MRPASAKTAVIYFFFHHHKVQTKSNLPNQRYSCCLSHLPKQGKHSFSRSGIDRSFFRIAKLQERYYLAARSSCESCAYSGKFSSSSGGCFGSSPHSSLRVLVIASAVVLYGHHRRRMMMVGTTRWPMDGAAVMCPLNVASVSLTHITRHVSLTFLPNRCHRVQSHNG